MSDGHCDVSFSDYSDDADPVEFWHETHVTARKPHRCNECDETIPVGERYRRVNYKFAGRLESEAMCGPCEEAAKEFDHRVGGTLWQLFEEEWDQGAHLQACMNRLTTARAKEHMRRRWLKWKRLE